MSSPSKKDTRSGALLPAVLALLLVSALAVAADEGRNALDTPAPKPAPTGETLYQIRCWQYGRLLFEERDLLLPADVSAGLKFRGTDRSRQPVYVTDTGNATCLIRSTPPRR